jgi:phage FluMu protein Com
MLPTYSSVSSAGLRQAPQRPPPAHSAAEDRASLELAMRLQAEERTAAHQRSQPAPAPPRPQSWSCGACTYENKGGAAECEVCGTKRAGGAPGPSSAAAGAVTVKCPKCTKLLRVESPASSPLFVCMSCNTTSRTDQHRV